MTIDGAGYSNPLKTVWQQQILNVTPNTNYVFQAWARAIGSPYGPEITLGFYANGSEIGTLSLTNVPEWQLFSVIWNSGSNTDITLSIIDLQTNNYTAGNDFALDDISFNRSTVPVPAAIWLFGSGVAALAGLRRLRRKKH